MSRFDEYKGWAFAWDIPRGAFLTRITAYNRKSLIAEAERVMGKPWRRIYREGGRAVKVTIVERS